LYFVLTVKRAFSEILESVPRGVLFVEMLESTFSTKLQKLNVCALRHALEIFVRAFRKVLVAPPVYKKIDERQTFVFHFCFLKFCDFAAHWFFLSLVLRVERPDPGAAHGIELVRPLEEGRIVLEALNVGRLKLNVEPLLVAAPLPAVDRSIEHVSVVALHQETPGGITGSLWASPTLEIVDVPRESKASEHVERGSDLTHFFFLSFSQC
jgi:hypothetical protein